MQSEAGWVDALLESGESLALLSLTGSRCDRLDDRNIGEVVEYKLRDDQTAPIGPTFKYEVLKTFGCGSYSRAVAFRRLDFSAGPRQIILAFRGVRPGTDQGSGRSSPSSSGEQSPVQSPPSSPSSPSSPSAPANRRSLASEPWRPAEKEDLAALCDGHSCSLRWLPRMSMKVSLGATRYHGSVWTHEQRCGPLCCRPGASGLSTWLLAQLAASASGSDPIDDILFLGLYRRRGTRTHTPRWSTSPGHRLFEAPRTVRAAGKPPLQRCPSSKLTAFGLMACDSSYCVGRSLGAAIAQIS